MSPFPLHDSYQSLQEYIQGQQKVMSYEKTKLAIIFADISKSTQLFEAYGNIRARNIVSHTLSILSNITTEYGGIVVKTIGDEVMCTFELLDKAIDAALRMPQAIQEDEKLSELGLSIKTGLHYGDVLQEKNDVYGDAVNIAARMVQIARPDQIITTKDTVQYLPDYQHSNLRSLGGVQVRGKQKDIEIFELLWQPDTTELTIMHTQATSPLATNKAALSLKYADKAFKLDKEGLPFFMGRGEKNNLVVRDQSVSRTHASIEYRRGNFVLIDRSTNGTFLQIKNEDLIFLHRDQIHLRREGIILLGQDGSEEDTEAIHFECKEPA